ncbi:MAG TPA: DUF4215 domain-containing protein [Candidatus Fimivivens sp.]|nr:DUF4215 domain-containing protein [Candidatus Fimivivens sp.]
MKRVNLFAVAVVAAGSFVFVADLAKACETPTPTCPSGVIKYGVCQPKETPVCGNGKVEKGEACDEGSRNGGDSCTKTCQKPVVVDPVCGNGKVEKNESCDDGNQNDGDSCTNTCENQIVKEVPVVTTVTNTVTNTVEKVVTKYKRHGDNDHDKKKKKDVLPTTGLPVEGVAGAVVSAAGITAAAWRKFVK